MSVDYDPLSDEAMVDPQRLYALLREHDPVHHMERYDAWALASFDSVWQACSDTDSFSVRRGQTPNQILLGEPAANLTFPELDPPEHRLRRRGTGALLHPRGRPPRRARHPVDRPRDPRAAARGRRVRRLRGLRQPRDHAGRLPQGRGS